MVIRLPQPKKKPAHPYQRQPIHPNTQRWEKKEMILKGFPATSKGEKNVSWLIKSITDKTILFQKSEPSPLPKANTSKNALQCGERASGTTDVTTCVPSIHRTKPKTAVARSHNICAVVGWAKPAEWLETGALLQTTWTRSNPILWCWARASFSHYENFRVCVKSTCKHMPVCKQYGWWVSLGLKQAQV